MIPILYEANETNFNHHGIGDLSDCVSAHVVEDRNGKYDLEFVYPVNGLHFDEIETDMIIKARANDIDAPQLFRIYSHTKPINFQVTFEAHHISYDLMYNPLPRTTLSGVTINAMQQVLDRALNDHQFEAYSDSETESTSEIGPCNAREALGGVDGSILDNWGGEYHFDNFKLELLKQRGHDTNVTIEYGKNLTDYSQEKALEDVYTSVYPYATKQDENGNEKLITLSEKIIHLSTESNYPTKRTLMLDLSQDESVTDEDSLRKAAQTYVKNNKIDQPSVSWTVKFQDLRKTEDYKKIAALESCGLCDYVMVHFSRYKTVERAEIISVDYNTLLEQYISMDLGEPSSDFVSEIQQSRKETKRLISPTGFLQQAINRATQAITGQSGGYVRLNPAMNPQEILIMNTPDINTATKVWRFNLGGLGYSHNGYNGPYELAMTMDGEIVADFIKTGVLRAIDIVGVNIKGSIFEGEDDDSQTSMRLTSQGLEFYKSGRFLGSIGRVYTDDEQMVGIENQDGDGIEIGAKDPNTGKYPPVIRALLNRLDILADTKMHGFAIDFDADSGHKNQIYESIDGQNLIIKTTVGIILAVYHDDEIYTLLKASYIDHDRDTIDAYADLDMHGWYIKNANIQDTSLAELKQDIHSFDHSAMDILKRVKIFEFRFKKEVADGKDHKKFGPVIGDGYETQPDEIMSPDKKGIDPYNERHLMIKAIQELSAKVDTLEKRVEELEGQ